MEHKQERRLISMKRVRRKNGLIFGLAFGLCTSLALWGFDGWLLAGASAAQPWLKLLAGGGIVVVAAGLAGWLVAVIENRWLGVLVWLVSGLVFGWVALRAPFGIATRVITALQPVLGERDLYPFFLTNQFNPWLIVILFGILAAPVGLLQSVSLPEVASQSWRHVSPIFYMGAGLALLVLFGFFADFWIYRPLRAPILAVHALLEKHVNGEPLPEGIDGAVIEPVGDYIGEDYLLNPAVYASPASNLGLVYIELENTWAHCFVEDGIPSACQLSLNRYGKRFLCLMSGGDEAACLTEIVPGALDGLVVVQEQVSGKDVGFSMKAMRGSVALLSVTVGGEEWYECAFRETGQVVYFESCVATR